MAYEIAARNATQLSAGPIVSADRQVKGETRNPKAETRRSQSTVRERGLFGSSGRLVMVPRARPFKDVLGRY